jgi:hypothetical protein
MERSWETAGKNEVIDDNLKFGTFPEQGVKVAYNAFGFNIGGSNLEAGVEADAETPVAQHLSEEEIITL